MSLNLTHDELVKRLPIYRLGLQTGYNKNLIMDDGSFMSMEETDFVDYLIFFANTLRSRQPDKHLDITDDATLYNIVLDCIDDYSAFLTGDFVNSDNPCYNCESNCCEHA